MICLVKMKLKKIKQLMNRSNNKIVIKVKMMKMYVNLRYIINLIELKYKNKNNNTK